MATQYNRFRSNFNPAAARARLIYALFGGAGLPTETVSLGGFAANAYADIEPSSNPLNRVLKSSNCVGHRLRYCHPNAGTTQDTVLIWCHGHDSTAKSTVYTANNTGSGSNNAQRMQMNGAPTNAHSVISGAVFPLQQGIGIVEVSPLGQYLNWANGIVGTMTIGVHTDWCADLGPLGVGMFLTPMLIAINTAIAAGKKPIIGGFSGGGWMAQLVAAIDPRVKLSFIHSGWPGKLAATAIGASDTGGDGEQIEPEIYHNPSTGTGLVNMHELAVMGADAPGRTQWNIWNVATSGTDTVFPMTAADVAGMNTDGLRGISAAMGGDLRFIGFDGLNDPCATFGSASAATYNATVGDPVTVSAQNSSSTITTLGGTFTYTGTGHHLMNQSIDMMTRQILNNAL